MEHRRPPLGKNAARTRDPVTEDAGVDAELRRGGEVGGRERAIRGGVWAALETWGMQAVQFLLFLVLARQLGPEVYGLIGIALTVNIIGEALIVEGGWIEVIVQKDDLDRRHLDAAFGSLLVMSGGLALLACLSAPVLATVFSEPSMLALVPALSLALPLRAAGVVPEAVLARSFRFKPLAVRTVAATLGAGSVAVALAFSGGGVWSLVALQLLQPLIALALVWRATSYRPARGHTPDHRRPLLAFVRYRFVERGLVAVDSLLPRLAIGYLLGPVTLGHYTMARKIIELAVQLLVRPVSRVALSSLSAVGADLDRLRLAVGRLVPLATAMAAPALIGLALVAPDVVGAAFGPEWLPAVPAVVVLSLLGLVVPASRILTVVLFARGRPDVQLGVTAVGLALLGGLFAVAPPSTLAAAAWLIVVRTAAMVPGQVWVTRRATGLDAVAPVARAAPSLLAVAVMAGAVLALRGWLRDGGVAGGILFVSSVGVGVSVYALTLLVVARPLVREVRGFAAARR